MAFNLKAGVQNVRSNVETLLKGKPNAIHLPDINTIAKKLAIPFEAARQMHAIELASNIAKTATNVAKAAVEAIKPKTAYADYGGMKDLEFTRQTQMDAGLPQTDNAWEKDRAAAIRDPRGHTTFVPATAADITAGRSTVYGGKVFTTPSGYTYTVTGLVSPSDVARNARLTKTALIIPTYISRLGEDVNLTKNVSGVNLLNKATAAATNRDFINKEIIRHFSSQPESTGINAFSFEGGSYNPGSFSTSGYHGGSALDNPDPGTDKYMEVK